MRILKAVVSKPVAVIGASLGALALAVSIIAPPASAATSIWQFSQGSYAIAESSGAGNATISIVNLRVWDGTVATGYVRVNSSISGRTYACSSQAFTGTTVTFLPGAFEPCTGTITFTVDPATGILSASAALTITSGLFSGPATGAVQGVLQTPVIAPLLGCAASNDDAARMVNVALTGSHPDATAYDLQIQGGGIPLTSIAPGLSIGVPYASLGYGGGYTATISARRADGQVVATCDMSVQVPWVAPGKPLIDSLIPGAGGLVTVNYSVADPATVLGIESSVDGGPWVRPRGSAPVGGSGGAFTISGLSAGRHLVTLRSVGLDPGPLTTQGQAQAVVIPAVTTSGSSASPAAAVPARPVTTVPGTSNGAGAGTNGALASRSGDAAIDAPCLAPDGTLYPSLYGTVGSQLTMAPNTHGMGTPTAFVMVGGSLAPGLMLDRAFGIVYGVPTQAGSWATTVRATFVDGSTRSGQFTTRVDADEQTLQYAARNVGSIGSALSIAPTTSAPAVGTAYRLVCGILPAGTRLDQRTGWITGTPTEVVSMPTPLRIAQATASGSAAASFILVVNPAGRVSVSYPAHPHVRVGKRIWLRPTVTGVGQITESRMWKGKLPRGLHLNRATGAVTGRIAHAGPTHTITIVATTKAGALLTAPAMRLRLQG